MVGSQDAANTADAARRETSPEVAEVHLEACVAFVGESGASDGVCLVCGYLGDDHADLFEFLEVGEVFAA